MVLSEFLSVFDASIRAVSPRSECRGGVLEMNYVSVVVDWGVWEGAFALARDFSNSAHILLVTHMSLELWQYFARARPGEMLFQTCGLGLCQRCLSSG